MFGIKRRERPERDGSGFSPYDRGGYSGLEGDFESERRRAASAGRETDAPYDGEGATPVLPATAPGLTHP
jgi:hypothetical protein